MVFGTVVFLAASAVHVVILAVVLALIYTAFTVVYLTERGFLLAKRFFRSDGVRDGGVPGRLGRARGDPGGRAGADLHGLHGGVPDGARLPAGQALLQIGWCSGRWCSWPPRPCTW